MAYHLSLSVPLALLQQPLAFYSAQDTPCGYLQQRCQSTFTTKAALLRNPQSLTWSLYA